MKNSMRSITKTIEDEYKFFLDNEEKLRYNLNENKTYTLL